MKYTLMTFCFLLLLGCNDKVTDNESAAARGDDAPKQLFVEHKAESTKLFFTNTVKETDSENYYIYPFIYNGAGVAVGDINNDGLPDVYFSGNSAKDKLYINKGDLVFEDISEASGIDEFPGWSTGVSFVDINGDDWLDIYVCRSGPSPDIENRTNRLFINNQDGTFSEEAKKYGIQNTQHSVQSAFFDYDLDGDLDMYLLNHPPKKRGSDLKFKEHLASVKAGKSITDVFYENVNGTYEVKTKEANLFNYGYRHGIAIGDVNKDGYPDMYISSDFSDPDLLYINQKDKSFKNTIDESFRHISFNSMGNELTDINNDGELDIYVVDMAPSDHFRSKAYMMSMDVKAFRGMVDAGLHHQYMYNTFQINNGNNTFSEIGQLSGTAKTDWSWAPLFFDMDHDGYKDLFVTNGIKENFLYRDINVDAKKKYGKDKGLKLEEFLDVVPSDISENIFYHNKNGVKFENKSGEWAVPSMYNSNGVATADFDNDGDLDFVVNNMDSSAILYESTASNQSKGNSIKIQLTGKAPNTRAIGAKIKVKSDLGEQIHELYTSRGYLSSVDTPVVFGLGNDTSATVDITWPDGTSTLLDNVKSNEVYTVAYDGKSKMSTQLQKTNNTLLSNVNPAGLNFVHKEDNFDEYTVQILLPHSQSTTGPASAKADVNNDGLEDLFIGGAAGQEAKLFIQNASGGFSKGEGDWKLHAAGEDTGALFIDFDNDNDLDLYVSSGGTQKEEGHFFFQDRMYVNDGKGNFKYNSNILPKIKISGKTVIAADVDNDGDTDLFVGGRIIPDGYPQPARSYMLINENSKFILKELPIKQMVASAVFSDYDGDGDVDLLTVGEWSPIQVFNNDKGNFTKVDVPSLSKTTGLWFSIAENDIDNDGDMDYFVGNLGLNAKFKVDATHEFHVYGNDFDDNGTYDIVLSGNYHGKLVPSRGRECSSQQMPFIKDKFSDFKSFANASLEDIYGDKLTTALHYQADMLSSVFLKNNGNGDFSIEILPWQSQIAPIQDFAFADIDGDGKDEILTVGNLYNVEVETQRYDASEGSVLRYDNGNFEALKQSQTGFATTGDSRKIIQLENNGKKLLVITNSNGSLDIFEIATKDKKSITSL
ncbi:VCBS repeat-containing protein [Ulvibacter antarcticus]|uniref:VCBS repeat protein n=1 Tax=Ulvibacter antarcticus TaxID=442714 RepID=A0A3L9Z0N4_9FLAO|nr:VCBS repeat-containing protein [Ulvibacter antarcticus]RMA64939.1 VCBS repeat protein [Ulvibacter antarcticus]